MNILKNQENQKIIHIEIGIFGIKIRINLIQQEYYSKE